MKIKGILYILLCLCLTAAAGLSGCGKEEDDAPAVNAMGRYVEQPMEYPLSLPQIQIMLEDGTLDVIGYRSDRDQLCRFNGDGSSWMEKEMSWLMPEMGSLVDLAYREDGSVYLLTAQMSDDEPPYRLYETREGASVLSEVDVDWYQDLDNDNVYYGGTLDFLADGGFVVRQMTEGICQYDAEGNFVRNYQSNSRTPYAVSGGSLYILDEEDGMVYEYDVNTQDLLRSLPFESQEESKLYSGAGGSVYAVNRDGLFRMVSGGSVWEKVVDGQLTSLSVPSLEFYFLREDKGGNLYLMCFGPGNPQLMKYTYDESVPTLPEYELTVFTVEDNQTIRQAVGEFQRKYPDTKITVQVSETGAAVTAGELVQVLNTEILAGKGPDVIVLDGMRINAYVEKGALLDLSDLAYGKIQSGELHEAVTKAFEQEGKLYALPAKFSLPLFFAEEGKADRMSSLMDVADYVSVNREMGLFGDVSPDRLIEIFLPASQPELFAADQADREKLASFLERIKVISEAKESLPYEMSDFVGFDTELYHWAFGRAHAHYKNIAGYDSLMTINIAMEKLGEAEAFYTLGIDSDTRVFLPGSVVGINVNCKQQEQAFAFLEVLFSEAVQDVPLEDGFPVNLHSLKNAMAEDAGSYASADGLFTEGEWLGGGKASLAYQEKIYQLALKANKATATDPALAKIVKEQSAGYFTGDKSLEQAVMDIAEKSRLYLSE